MPKKKNSIEVEHVKTLRTTSLLTRQIKTDGQWLEPWQEEEELLVRKYVGPVAKVGVQAGLTVNIGNWESAKISVSCELPCYIEEFEEVSRLASAHVARRIDEDLAMMIGVRADPGRLKRLEEASDQDVFRPEKKIYSRPEVVGNETSGSNDDEESGKKWEAPSDEDGKELF